jgi:hypothetical protein
MTATWDDERVAALVDKGGMEGLAMYGLYWRIQEIIASQMEGKDPSCSVRYTVTRWSLLLSLRGSLVFSTLSRLGATGLVTVTRDDSGIVVKNRNLLKYRDEYSRKSGVSTDNIPSRTEGEGEGEQNKTKEQKPFPEKPSASGEEKVKSRRPKNKPESKAEDHRYEDFKADFFKYYSVALKTEVRPPWDGREGKALAIWLKATPDVTQVQWRTILNNRRKSHGVAHGDRLSSWINRAMAWLSGLADNSGRRMEESGNGKSFDKGVRSAESIRRYHAEDASNQNGGEAGLDLALLGAQPGNNQGAGGGVLAGSVGLLNGATSEIGGAVVEGHRVLAVAGEAEKVAGNG